jgi:hypothetical protein
MEAEIRMITVDESAVKPEAGVSKRLPQVITIPDLEVTINALRRIGINQTTDVSVFINSSNRTAAQIPIDSVRIVVDGKEYTCKKVELHYLGDLLDENRLTKPIPTGPLAGFEEPIVVPPSGSTIVPLAGGSFVFPTHISNFGRMFTIGQILIPLLPRDSEFMQLEIDILYNDNFSDKVKMEFTFQIEYIVNM